MLISHLKADKTIVIVLVLFAQLISFSGFSATNDIYPEGAVKWTDNDKYGFSNQSKIAKAIHSKDPASVSTEQPLYDFETAEQINHWNFNTEKPFTRECDPDILICHLRGFSESSSDEITISIERTFQTGDISFTYKKEGSGNFALYSNDNYLQPTLTKELSDGRVFTSYTLTSGSQTIKWLVRDSYKNEGTELLIDNIYLGYPLASDSDNDGVNDNEDLFPEDAGNITRNQSFFDTFLSANEDTDFDGVSNQTDAFPLDHTEQLDHDSDGIGNYSDTDLTTDPLSQYYKTKIDLTALTGISPWSSVEGTGTEEPSITAGTITGVQTFELNKEFKKGKVSFDYKIFAPGVYQSPCVSSELEVSLMLAFFIDDVPKRTFTSGNCTNPEWSTIEFEIEDNQHQLSWTLYMSYVGATPSDNPTSVYTQNRVWIRNVNLPQGPDEDGDNYPEVEDIFPQNVKEWADFDNDGVGDNGDTDDDNDGVQDNADAFPFDATEAKDSDSDGIGNNADSDDDNDQMPDSYEAEKGLNPLISDADKDSDNDGYTNVYEYLRGTDPTSEQSVPSVITFFTFDKESELADWNTNYPETWNRICDDSNCYLSGGSFWDPSKNLDGTTHISVKRKFQQGRIFFNLSYADTFGYIRFYVDGELIKAFNGHSNGDEYYSVELTAGEHELTWEGTSLEYAYQNHLLDNVFLGYPLNKDSDGDGVNDDEDLFPDNPEISTRVANYYHQLLSLPDGEDLDSDGVLNGNDYYPLDPAKSTNTDNDFDGFSNDIDTDDDNDGTGDLLDTEPLDGTKGQSQTMLLKDSSGWLHLSQIDSRQEIKQWNLHSKIYAGWEVQAFEDFNGDTYKDNLKRHSVSGAWYLTANNGFDYRYIDGDYGGYLTQLPSETEWSLQSANDFNGDSKSDLLLRHADGTWRLYLVQPGNFDEITPAFNQNPDWQLMTAADFNGDSHKDILVRHKHSGYWFIYFLNKGAVSGGGYLTITTTSNWQYAASGDFNGDGNDDLLLRHKLGHWILYYLNDNKVVSYIRPELSSSTSWSVAHVADYNNDGTDDLMLQNEVSQRLYQYFFNQNGIQSKGYTDTNISNKGKVWSLKANQ